MIRWSVLIASTITAMSAAFIVGAAVPTKPANPPADVKAEVKPQVVVGQKTGYFNMAKVMREYKKAKTAVARLNARKNRMSVNLIGLRSMHAELQNTAKQTTDANRKAELEDSLILLTREIEDLDRAINKILNEKATIIISELYDEMHATAATLARENGLVAILAYPDAVTPEERESPFVKELKLKPPACQPFYLDSSAEYSDELIRRLNDKFNENDD